MTYTFSLTKGEERCFEVIDLNALASNIRALRAHVGEEMKIFAVVKANAYGLGVKDVARVIEPYTDFYAVATFDEAVEMNWISHGKPVLILGPVEDSCYADCVRLGIRPVVFDLHQAEALSKAAVQLDREALCHIAVDTGMTRIGVFPDEEGLETVKRIAALPGIKAEGIFTHLATMDCKSTAHAIQQVKRFKRFVLRLQKEGLSFPVVHVANSAASLLEGGFKDDPIINGCRYGISLYGVYPGVLPEKAEVDSDFAKACPVRPVVSLYARVTRVAEVKAGTGVSYGRTFITKKPTRIATISAGYADGYPRALSNKGAVLIHGKRCKILGRVCMDQFMVDVSGMEDIKVGDVVTLVGRGAEGRYDEDGLFEVKIADGKSEEITIYEIEAKSGRLSYEVLCLVGERVKKVYLGEG